MTLVEHYGVTESETVADEEWMVEVARKGWPVFCCDSKHRKRRRPAEREALLRTGARKFVLNGNITAAENVERVLTNLEDIARRVDSQARSSTGCTPTASNG